ncbi:glucose 1-dehydrogenase [Nostoc flagelliforme FACHB-838]|uniref:Glucose 1-dehydrogenase n=1 Tax=Nostoc flagelliforme FACHB-838 TaxID=2692904 RepID=A0ABR8DV22_9NOSO|nr:glucose 1-dehydrogenase [Nostoc flagelliforme]MBD2533078.1 glucose 1-dehydrogenase [Nostoc flagelliforme FACHB-838]
MKKLEGKVALVTGSSGGIGQAIAVHLAEQGADVVIDYRSHPEGAEETLSKVEAAGSKGLTIKADLSVISDIRQLIDQGIQYFGKLDILVNNAGIDGRNADFWNITEADYDAVINLNLKGTFFATQAIVQHFIETKRTGKIINISSTHEEIAFPHFTAYCASKGGVKMTMRNLAVELGPLGITINNVAPGAIETPINSKLLNDPEKLGALLKNIPLGRLGKPQDIAPIVAFLASADADYITGATLYVDGGLSRNYHEQ